MFLNIKMKMGLMNYRANFYVSFDCIILDAAKISIGTFIWDKSWYTYFKTCTCN